MDERLAPSRPRQYRPLVDALHRRRRLRAALVQAAYAGAGVVLALAVTRGESGPALAREAVAGLLFALALGMPTLVMIAPERRREQLTRPGGR